MKTLSSIAAAVALAGGAPAGAVTIASSSFDTDAEGWTNGDYTAPLATAGVAYDPSGWIEVGDAYPYNFLYAPGAYVGDQSAAYGGSISFDISDVDQDMGIQTSLIVLHGAGLTMFGGIVTIPDLADFTSFSVALRPENFYIGDQNTLAGVQATETQFRAVLGSLTAFGVNADYKSGGDLVRLDNVVLTAGAVPEPATWLMLALGFGVTGAAVRRRRTWAPA